MDVRVRKDFIIKKILPEISSLESLCRNRRCLTALDISRAMVFVMNLFSSALLISGIMTVKTSAEDQAERTRIL